MFSKLHIVCLILVIIIVIYFLYKPNHNSNDENIEFKVITPQCVMGAINSNKNVYIVNVLSDKMPVYIGSNNIVNKSISKYDFENILKNNNNQIPNETDLVILMCAAWSCGAGESYFDELIKRNVNVSKVVDYAGGIHEWCVYNKLNSEKFNIFKKSDENMVLMSEDEISTLLKNTAHGYKTNTLIDNNDLTAEYCKLGIDLTDYL